MAAADLSFQGLSTGLSDGSDPSLILTTPGGTVRRVPLTRRQLVRIIRTAADALEVMDRENRGPL